MEQVSLRAESREAAGSGPARRLRAEGDVPAILYGRGLDSTSLSVNRRDLYAALHTEAGTNALINLEVGSDKYLTIARELQRHPVRGEIIHLDFINISLDEEITAEVAIEYVGEPAGATEGGIVETIKTSVMVAALPMAIPSGIQVDISELAVGDTLTATMLPAMEGVEYLEDEDAPLVTVIVPRILEETVAVELDEDGMPIEPAEGEEGEAAEGAEGEAAEGADGGDSEDEG
jgi:large subunit ribosomal protein L25